MPDSRPDSATPNNPAYNPSETRFSAIFDQSPFSVQLLTPDGRTTHVNPAWKKLWGMSDEFIQKFILKDYNMLEDQELVRRGIMPYIRRGFEGETTRIPEVCYDPKANGMEGDARWISAVIFPLKDESHTVRELVLIHTDTTIAHQAAEEQARASAVLQVLADTTAVLHRSIDPHQLVDLFAQSLLPAFADACVIDLKEGTEISRRVARHYLPARQAALEEIRKCFAPKPDSPQPSMRVIRTGKTELIPEIHPEDLKDVTQNPEHARLAAEAGIRSLLAVPLQIRGAVIGSITFAMTEDHRHFSGADVALGEELARRAATAIDNARLYHDTRRSVQQRDEFISIASHELKTPLTTLKLHAQLAARQLSHDATSGLSREYSISLVETVNRQINRLNRLIDDMLDISRITTGKLSLEMEDLDLSRLVSDVVRRFKVQLAADGIELQFTTPGPVPVRADPLRVDQVIDNLLTNAVRYGNRRPIEVTIQTSAGQARVSVRDYGAGIAAEDHARIFERFERASSVSLGGLGLGLYISRDIARAHGGDIRLESEPNLGATFTLILPLR